MAPPTLQPGQQFDAYVVEGLLAQSDWSHTYAGTDPAGQRVLLRLFGDSARQDSSLIHRIRRDADAARTLQNPTVARVLDVGYTPDGTPWVATEFVEGQTLRHHINTSGALSPELVRHVLVQVLGALSEAHGVGLAHRDIRPENVFIAGTGPTPTVKLVDFAAARPLDTTALPPDTFLPQTVVGTPGYLPPEILRGHPATPAADLYALGITAVEALGSGFPWPGNTPADILQAQLSADPAVSAQVADTPLYSECIAGMIAADQIRRASSASAVLAMATAVNFATTGNFSPDTVALTTAGPLGEGEEGPTALDYGPPSAVVAEHGAVPAGRKSVTPTPVAKKGAGAGLWISLILVLLLLGGGGFAGWYFLIRDDGSKSASSSDDKDEAEDGEETASDELEGDDGEASDGTREAADSDGAAPNADASATAAAATDPDPTEPNNGGNVALDVAQAIGSAVKDVTTGTGVTIVRPLTDEMPALVDGSSMVFEAATPITLNQAEPGDPLYSLCKEADMLDRCFIGELEGGLAAEITEQSMGREGSALSIVERHHPFELLVVDGRIRVGVPKNYVWGQFTIQAVSGEQFLILVYSDRSLTRKAIAQYGRSADTRMKELRKQLGVSSSTVVPGFFPFYAEFAELTGDSLPEMVVQGHQIRAYEGERVPFSLLVGADGKRELGQIDAVHPELDVYTVNMSTGPVSLVAEGHTGCDVRGTLELWRFDGTTPVAWFDTGALEQIQSLPQRYMNAGANLRVVVIQDEGVLERIEVFDAEDACREVREGYAIAW